MQEKMGGGHTCGQRPRLFAHPPPRGNFGSFPYNHFDLAAFLKSFLQKIMAIILKEKCIAIEEKKYLSFESKWSDYTAIYDFRGPDNI